MRGLAMTLVRATGHRRRESLIRPQPQQHDRGLGHECVPGAVASANARAECNGHRIDVPG